MSKPKISFKTIKLNLVAVITVFAIATILLGYSETEGEEMKEGTRNGEAKQKPVWLTSQIYDYYAQQDRVPLPWTPVECQGKTISVWGRTMRWHKSLLPDSIQSQGRELLAEPIQVVVSINRKEKFVPLKRFRILQKRQSRVDFVADGELDGLHFKAEMFVEFDGFLWVNLKVEGKGKKVNKMQVVVPLEGKHMRLYQTFARPLAGWIPNRPLNLPWLADAREGIVNFYHWFGDEDGGLGFTYTSLQNWVLKSEENFCTFLPDAKSPKYVINLVEQPSFLDGRVFQFGIQATPIKPLPPDFTMMKGSTVSFEPWATMNQIPDDIDMALVWPMPAGMAMQSLNDPYNVDRKVLEEVRDFCHQKGIAFLGVAHCPHRISPLNKEFAEYASEWKRLPENILEWQKEWREGAEKIPHYMACGKSYTYRKWLFYGWAIENVLKLGLDGLYSDGWMTGQMGCNNALHGCGWEDEKGKRHLTVPVLEGREFNRVMCLFLEDHVQAKIPKTAPERKGFPRYHFWIHSWEFVPSVMGFATAWLTGEFAAYPLQGPSMQTPEGTYGKCLGLGLFRARCLSTNWGVPNLFDPIMPEGGENPPTDRQTLMAYAWFLPHGVPIGLIEYMNAKTTVKISEVFRQFEGRKAQFFPAWRSNPYLVIEAPIDQEVMVAVWQHHFDHQVLAVVSNLKLEETVKVRLRWTGFHQPKIRNALTGESFSLKDDLLTLTLPPESFALLWIER